MPERCCCPWKSPDCIKGHCRLCTSNPFGAPRCDPHSSRAENCSFLQLQQESCSITHVFLTCQMSLQCCCSVPNPASAWWWRCVCFAALDQVCTPRPEHRDTPLYNPDMRLCLPWLWLRVGLSVISDYAILNSEPLPFHYSAHTAEML